MLLNASRTTALTIGLLCSASGSLMESAAVAQAPAAAPAPAAGKVSKLGTVKAIDGSTLTVAPATGDPVTVTVADSAKVLQLAPGSTDLKTATAAQLSDVAVGDRVLATGTAGDGANSLTAVRVILMKSGDIAQKNAQQQEDWQKRGSGGIVTAKSGDSVTIAVGAKKVAIVTTSKTIFRRYSGDSVKFEDAVPSSLAQLQAGDQLRVRGDKSEDGSSIQAEEIVSGSFKNLSGKVDKIDAAAGTITLKDLATKKVMTVNITANSVLHRLPEGAAARLATANGRGSSSGAGAGGSGGNSATRPAGGDQGGAGRSPGGPGGGAGGRAPDLSQMVARLPAVTLSDLKTGDAVMIVASESAPGSSVVTAITVLSGVEPILTANPSGGGMTLSPWSMGGGEGGGGEGGGGI